MSELLLCCGGSGIHAASCPSWRDTGHAPVGGSGQARAKASAAEMFASLTRAAQEMGRALTEVGRALQEGEDASREVRKAHAPDETEQAIQQMEGEHFSRGPLPLALGEIQRTIMGVQVWDGTQWVPWDGISRQVSQVLTAHQPSRGMQVSMGTTCSCGAWLKHGLISQHQAQVLAEAGLLKKVPQVSDMDHLCEVMHDAYEAAAAEQGWQTQERSRKPWGEVPEANKRTMRVAVWALLVELGLLKEDG